MAQISVNGRKNRAELPESQPSHSKEKRRSNSNYKQRVNSSESRFAGLKHKKQRSGKGSPVITDVKQDGQSSFFLTGVIV